MKGQTPTPVQVERHQDNCPLCQRLKKTLSATYTNNAFIRQHVDDAVTREQALR